MWRYLGVVTGLFGVIALCAVSVYLAWPWVLSAHMRLTRWELLFTTLAEAGALVWFAYFLIKFMVTSELDSAFDEDIAHAPGKQLLALVVVLAAAVDLGATFYFEALAEARRESAVDGECRIEKTKIYSLEPQFDKRGEKVGEIFCALTWCTVIDADGKTYPTYRYGKSREFPESVHEAIIYDRLPATMEIVYDEKFPRRFWIPGVEDDYMSVWRLSQEITVFAFVFTLLVLITNKVLFPAPIPVEICPFIGVTLRLAIAGGYMFFHDLTSVPPL